MKLSSHYVIKTKCFHTPAKRTTFLRCMPFCEHVNMFTKWHTATKSCFFDQGFGGYWIVKGENEQADLVVNNLSEICDYF